MSEMQNSSRRRITIAIMALGGQGGGVLADWIIGMARRENYVAQGTSVPGVAQRTGATIYYIELFPKTDRPPILALSPMPGDVDIIIAAELMEAGRAILRGFVDQDRTTLIASTHRIYAISEKSAMGDGIANRDYVLDAARTRARNFMGFDMELAADQAGSMISPVLFGALAASGALPFRPGEFRGRHSRQRIRGRCESEGLYRRLCRERPIARRPKSRGAFHVSANANGAQFAGAYLKRNCRTRPGLAIEGVRRLLDYQDAAYAELYLDRLGAVAALDDWRHG